MTKQKNTKSKSGVKSIKDVLLNLTVEFDDLQGKIERLWSALCNEDFITSVGDEQAGLLNQQYNAMVDYRDVLAIRLALVDRQFRTNPVK